MRVLVVEDELDVADLVARVLRRDGHAVSVAHSLAEAEAALTPSAVDLIVLDLVLGDGSGLSLVQSIRKRGDLMPILLLTSHGEVPRRIESFEAGADDFLSKPFAVAELRARVRALGRRGPISRSSILRVADIELDLAARRATRDGTEAVPITAREWAIIELFAAHRGRLIQRQEILASVWGDTGEAASASLDVIVGRIRRKLGPLVIRTVRGEGYALGDG
jgi:two-component system, OmpR family, response regulator